MSLQKANNNNSVYVFTIYQTNTTFCVEDISDVRNRLS